MEFGAHVSSSGGIDTAIDRIEAIGGDCVQVFTQSPRMWRPTNHKPEAIERFHEKRRGGGDRRRRLPRALPLQPRGARRRDLREVDPDDVQHRRRGIGDRGRRRHLPRRLASRRRLRGRSRADDRGADADPRALRGRHVAADGELGRHGRARSGARSTSSRRWSSGSTTIRGSAICLDSCHLYASGYDVTDPAAVDELVLRARRPNRPRPAARAAHQRQRRRRSARTATATRTSSRA